MEWIISIHTTLAGGDDLNHPGRTGHSDFNPHHPRGWRRLSFPLVIDPVVISIHTTLAGGDIKAQKVEQDAIISIHTTLAGGDVKNVSCRHSSNNFNPHHPRGWRPSALWLSDSCQAAFQSTPPSRVATPCRRAMGWRFYDFNPHHPRGWRRTRPSVL